MPATKTALSPKPTRRNSVRIGTTFNYAYADSSSLWTVVEKRGQDTYTCEVKAHPQHGTKIDWLGTKKVFGGEEIRHARETETLWKGIAKSADDFWASRKAGEIVHYHNGFGDYVRGVIEITKDGPKMRPIALLGEWRHDLPMRLRDGTVRYSYNVKKIRFPNAESLMTPNDGCMWESANFSKPMGPKRDFDPTKAQPLDLSDPAPLEGDAAEAARLDKLRMDIGRILSEAHANPKEGLRLAREMLEGIA